MTTAGGVLALAFALFPHLLLNFFQNVAGLSSRVNDIHCFGLL